MSEDAFTVAMQRAPQMELAELLGTAEQWKTVQGSGPLIVELYKRWIAYHGTHPALHAVYFNYGISLSDIGDSAGAANAFRAAIAIKPDFAPPYVNLGGLLERMGLPNHGVEVWNAMVQNYASVNGDSVNYKLTGLKQMGRVLEASNSPAAAEEVLRQSLAISQDQDDVMQHFISLRQGQCKWPPAEPPNDKLTRARLVKGISPLSVACYTDDPLFHLTTSHRYNRKSVGFPKEKIDFEMPAKLNKKLRIGYVSSDLRHHAVGFAMTDVFECHDRKKYDIYAYYCGVDAPDNIQERIKQSVHWVDITKMTDEEAARKIHADGIDILIDLNGYTKDARTKAFALRPVPVIVNWFGFPNSMGSPYHHYIIGDDIVTPKGAEVFFTEKVLRLPCYQPNDRKRIISPNTPTRASAGLPEEATVFCSLNGMQKMTSLVLNRWIQILREVPNSVLWLLTGTPETNQRLRERAAAQGIAPERLVYAEKMPNPDHLARYVLADLFLDSFPYGAHTTASDSLWMGVPILTLMGRSFAARVCADLVTAAGFPELVTRTPDEYVQKAIALGRDRTALKTLRERVLTARTTSLLFDTPKLVKHLEALYEEMRDDYNNGKLPKPDLRNLEIYHEIAVEEDLENIELLSDDAYIARYRQRLAEIDDLYPVPPDDRLWNDKPIKLFK